MPQSEVMRRLRADEFDRCTIETSLQRRKNYELDRKERERLEQITLLARAKYEAMKTPIKCSTKRPKVKKVPSTKESLLGRGEMSLYVAYYAPPLIARKRQNIEPDFFADGIGAEAAAYHLPERLSDELGVEYDCY